MTQAQNKERIGYEKASEKMDSIFEKVCNIAVVEVKGTDKEFEEAVQSIQNDAVSVEVRSGWVYADMEEMLPEEYRIVLCDGGPRVEIRGDLDSTSFEPTSAHLYYADQDESGEYFGDNLQTDALLLYAKQFYFAG